MIEVLSREPVASRLPFIEKLVQVQIKGKEYALREPFVLAGPGKTISCRPPHSPQGKDFLSVGRHLPQFCVTCQVIKHDRPILHADSLFKKTKTKIKPQTFEGSRNHFPSPVGIGKGHTPPTHQTPSLSKQS